MLRSFITIFVLFVFSAVGAHATDTIHHKVSVTLDPVKHTLRATDTITIPASIAKEGMVLQLNSDLTVKRTGGNVGLKIAGGDKNAADLGMDRDNDSSRTLVRLTDYVISGVKDGRDAVVTVTLNGIINNPVQQLNEEYARGFSQSPGLIEEQGIYLSGATYWVPTMKDTLITYDMDVTLPVDWRSVSQGGRLAHDTGKETHHDSWQATTPTEEIYVIAAKFSEYELPVGNVTAMAFLRTPDAAMANRYLTTTAQYMEMYRGLIGPYPYTKFALVENFWETGYGMPSFTLLGSQVIRFPFILHSSYPHELLHNWWGNGVFIDFETGNWAEGLTAYMADHLVAEQRGTGAAYRRSTLQRYTNYVDETTDFPLREFRGRYNAPTEAVGYGKTGMVFDMLRLKVGDENFKRSFQRFYRNHKYKVGTYGDIRAAFEDVSGKDLKAFFSQWVDGKGAPALTLAGAKQSGDELTLTLKQVQKGDAFSLLVPVATYTADSVDLHFLQMDKKTQNYKVGVKGSIVRVEVDPAFNVFRRLHWAEIPPSLGNAFGANKVTMILPTKTSAALIKRYDAMAAIWGSDKKVTVVKDSELKSLPKDGAVWVFGRNNRFYSVVTKALESYDADISKDAARFGKQKLSLADNSTIIAVRHPDNPQNAVVGLTIHNDAAVKGLSSKLLHYGKYSYLAFTNTAPDNSAKGQWPAVGSPLVVVLDKDASSTAKLKPRPALAQLKPVFNGTRMMSDLNYLASEALEGRGVGTAGLEKAGDYIAEEFKAAGLKPAGDKGSWFQSFEMNGPDGKPVTVKNVVGVIPGKNPKLKAQSVVLSAHYDHLGRGWPNVRAAFKGQIHPGANDNASGTTVLLELARSMAKSAPERSIIFLATTAEESGLLGARHYVKTMKDYPVEKVIANVNMDTVGREAKKFMVFGTPSATEWRFIFMGTTATTGIETELVMQTINASDHTAFLEAGIPAIHLFSSGGDYHKPSDTADKISLPTLMRAASLTKEVVEYLGQRPEPLTSTLKPVDPNAPKVLPPARPSGGRKVSTGTVPNFAFSGKGVKVDQVVPNSPGAKAGLMAGDIIVEFGGGAVTNLRDYTGLLGKYSPGDTVDVVVERDGKKVPLKLTLAAR